MLSSKMDEAEMSEYNSDAMDEVIFCTDEDYETAEIIKLKALANEPQNAGMINGKKKESLSK